MAVAVFGVFAKKVIQNRTLFGPYEGEETETWDYGREDRLKLTVRDRSWSSRTKRKRHRSIGFLYYPVNLPHQAKAMPSDVAFQLGPVPV